MSHQYPMKYTGPGRQQVNAAKVLDLAQSIYSLPDSSQMDIEAYVKMRVLLDRVRLQTRQARK